VVKAVEFTIQRLELWGFDCTDQVKGNIAP
jgi:hypothetical protein